MKPITRRHMLKTSFLGTAAAGLPLIAKAGGVPAGPAAKPRLKVIVTGGHPGDPEYGCGGTIALFSELGHEVVIVYLNKGDPGEKSSGPTPPRVAEATQACAILKARPVFAGQIDAHAVVDQAHYEAFHRLIEAEQPDVLFTQWPIDNHPDHRAIANLSFEAWRRMGRKFALYYYEVSNGEDTVQFAPTHYVDITRAASRKRAACYAHASQAPDKFYALQQMVTRMRGIESGCQEAEGYIHHVQSPAFPLPAAS
jgi:N-acetylglucosamine malate deacetylase 1